MNTTPQTVQTIQTMLACERESRQLTNDEHAAQLGISKATYYRVKRGKLDKLTVSLVDLALRHAASPTH